jgi:hypothetical protein
LGIVSAFKQFAHDEIFASVSCGDSRPALLRRHYGRPFTHANVNSRPNENKKPSGDDGKLNSNERRSGDGKPSKRHSTRSTSTVRVSIAAA